MRTLLTRALFLLALVAGFALGASAQTQGAAAGQGAFELHFDQKIFEQPFSGDVFVAFAASGEPRQAMLGWFGAPPVMRFAVKQAQPGGAVTVSFADAAAHHPLAWDGVEAKPWRVQAIARRSRTGRTPGQDEGDAYSAVVDVSYDPHSQAAVRLDLSTVVVAHRMAETERLHVFELVSPSLSKFYGFDYTLRAGVLLPSHFGEQDERYPVVYSVTGFGGTYEDIARWVARATPGSALDECVIVVPDANNRYGHSVFCDSASIGPWGKALVTELIPALEAEFSGAGAEQRYVTGVSSGGWSSLWLQVAYPEAFAGCWSHCPDPIDFHDFQGIDLYDPLPDGKPRNMYVDEHGAPRPLARRDGKVLVTYEDFVRREDVFNPGGQIRSFEATFSALAADGTPRRIFDVATGAIDHAAAAAWRPYDISDRLLTNWPALRPRLRGKIHLFAGELDTFYLQGAVQRFRAQAEAKGMLDDMQVEIIPGMVHTLYAPGQEAMERTIEERRHAPSSTQKTPVPVAH